MFRCKSPSLLAVLVLVLLSGVGVAHAATATGTDTNTVWVFISKTPGIVQVWKVMLGFVDFIVVGGLILAAFANIFRLPLKNYQIKEILPGLIIGIFLANLSFFIMRLFIESSTILAQGVGIFASSYLGPANAIGDDKAVHYLFLHAAMELGKSLFLVPQDWSALATITGTAVVGGITAVTVFALPFLTGTTAALGILAVGSFLIVVLIPLVLFFILVFLLYIRNFVLILLFILSPLAFFALGFPPFRGLWQKWWGTFWKWLLMEVAAFAVIAITAIFLHYVNDGVTVTNERSVINWIFVNGVAIALLFFANRIPFMWGSLFGIKVMEEWAKKGKQATQFGYRTAKMGGDAYQTRKAGLPYNNRFETLKSKKGDAAGLEDFNNLHGLNVKKQKFMEKDATGADVLNLDRYYRAMQQELASKRLKDQKDARNRNIIRAPEATYAGIKKYMSIAEEEEKKAIESSEYYGGIVKNAAEQTVYKSATKVRRDKLFDKQANIAKGIDDVIDVQGALRAAMRKWNKAHPDIDEAQMVDVLEKYRTASDADKKVAKDIDKETFGELEDEEIYKLFHLYDRGTRLLNQTVNNGYKSALVGDAIKYGYAPSTATGTKVNGVAIQKAWLRNRPGAGGGAQLV